MPKETVLRVAKVEYKKSTYLDFDPIKAIQIMKHACFEVLEGESTGPIFLYLIVVNDESGQYVVAAMISSTHNAVAILNFLNEWVRLGAPHAKIVNCDGPTTLITAIIPELLNTTRY